MTDWLRIERWPWDRVNTDSLSASPLRNEAVTQLREFFPMSDCTSHGRVGCIRARFLFFLVFMSVRVILKMEALRNIGE